MKERDQQSIWSPTERKCFHLIYRTKSGALLQIHAFMLRNALEFNVNILTKFITTCASVAFLTSWPSPLAGIRHARRVFDHRPQRNDTFLCNSMIKAYVEISQFAESFSLYQDLRRETRFFPDGFTFMALAKSCGLGFSVWEGKEVHGLVIRTGFSLDLYISTALVDMYSKLGKMDCATNMFDEMMERNQVSWTALVGGHLRSGDMVNARELFNQMPEKDLAAFNLMVDGYVKLHDMVSARSLYNEMPDRNVVSWTSMIHGYCCNGDVESARLLFDSMPEAEKNLISWNSMIGGYCKNKNPSEALKLFHQLQSTTSLEPDAVTVISILPAVADLGALELGNWIHRYVQRKNLDKVTKVSTALVDMYAKCGEIKKARRLFEEMLDKETVSWNALINGLAVNGYGKEALEVFLEMQRERLRPNEITMIGVLSACSHSGLLNEGKRWFKAMEEFGLEPQIEHYGCMVDLLGRAGCLEEAEKLIDKMPYDANGIIMSSFLFACVCHKDVVRAERVMKSTIEMEPLNDGNYVMLRNLYANENRWRDENRIKGLMKESGMNKEVGCSVVEVDGKIREFLAGYRIDPHSDLVNITLVQLGKHMKEDLN